VSVERNHSASDRLLLPEQRLGSHRHRWSFRTSPDDDFSIAESPPSRQTDEVGADTLRFAVEKAKINWGTFFQDMMRSGRGAASSQFENYSGRGPSVVACNANGEKRVIRVTKKLKDAHDQAGIIERDFRTLSTSEWCERYDVPASFVTG
jgi:hypothetical protein